MKEIVVISGKGGTGKTSITASIAALPGSKTVLADCDVDAADLHLVTAPAVRCTTPFTGGHKAHIDPASCNGCGKCIPVCRFDAVHLERSSEGHPGVPVIDRFACEGCGVCVRICSAEAIRFPQEVCGEWYISDTRFGTMVHARLDAGAENSGKLVTLLRREARRLAEEEEARRILVDGSPGIGCPVIASMTGADVALVVTEPTVSGVHDLQRIISLAGKLAVTPVVCVNKWDLNADGTDSIQTFCRERGIRFAGRIRYDALATAAQYRQLAVVETAKDGSAADIAAVWNCIATEVRMP